MIVKRLLSYSKGYKKEFLLAVIGMIFVAVCTSLSAYLVKPVLDDIFINKDRYMLSVLPIAIVVVYVLKSVGRYMQSYYMRYIGEDVIRKIRNDLLENIIHLDIDFFYKNRSGELISRITNDITRVQSIVSNLVPETIREVLTIVSLIVVVVYQNYMLAFYSLILLPIAIYPLSRLAKRMRQISKKSQEKISDLTSRLSEIFNNIEAIKTCSTEKIEVDKFKVESYGYFGLNLKAVRTSEMVSPIMETIGALAIAMVIYIGGNEVIKGNMSVGSFFSFMTALFMLYTPIKRLSTIYNLSQDAISAGERIFDFMDKQPSINSGTVELKDVNEIEFKNLYLSYDKKEALKNINLIISNNQKVALIGDSGGGKSSFVNLLVRFYDASNGSLLINGVDIKDYSIKSLRDNIAYVTQRIYIFNDTVANNVIYGSEFDEVRVIEALKDANAYDFVSDMPDGIYTKLNEFGANLSGGQRQRVAIARAIYKNPKILILDEATSALDNVSQELIIKAVDKLTKDKISFVIAHRLDTIKNSDTIIELKDGEIKRIEKKSL